VGQDGREDRVHGLLLNEEEVRTGGDVLEGGHGARGLCGGGVVDVHAESLVFSEEVDGDQLEDVRVGTGHEGADDEGGADDVDQGGGTDTEEEGGGGKNGFTRVTDVCTLEDDHHGGRDERHGHGEDRELQEVDRDDMLCEVSMIIIEMRMGPYSCPV